MRMILLLVQLATCCAIGSDLQCHSCNLEGPNAGSWDWVNTCKLTRCNKGEQCFVTKEQNTGNYQVGCKAACKADDNTKCCNNADGCNNWLDVSAAPAWKNLEAIKAACDFSNNQNNLKGCVEAISSTKTLKCYSCPTPLGSDYFTLDKWDLSAKCTLTQCAAGEQCFVTKDSGAGTYQVGCKANCEGDANTKCCDSDGCNNWLDVADAKQQPAVKTECTNDNTKTLKQCVDAIIKTKTPKCYSCSPDIGANYFSNDWNWADTCKLTSNPCPAEEQCSITKVSGTYQVGCKGACEEDANTKCCDANGCNNWLDEAAAAWKKVEAIKAACNSSSNNVKDCLDAIDPTWKANVTSGGGGLAGALGLPLVLAISVIVLVVLG
ncbi:uncharacterized protein LOC129192674 [Dunckerocampus dactyliophorus]|uniref:uncharacterized protein LOC129192674 n=1 Tax=Dunckerocampus dactyliophorus TaxID=161453 RepID=UPI0024072B32|nr:uncharacterized protein LOC129192674 [Dunckerocampus dactyliophorus]